MKLRYMSLLIGLSLLLVSCQQTQEVEVEEQNYEIKDIAQLEPIHLDACEAMFRHLMKSDSAYKTAYIKLMESDPPPEFLDRLKDLPVSIKHGSNFTEGRGNLLFTVHSIKDIGSNQFELSAGKYGGPLYGAGGLYIVTLQNGEWTIESGGYSWIS